MLPLSLRSPRWPLLAASALTLVLGASPLAAQPGNAQGAAPFGYLAQGQSQGASQGQGRGQGAQGQRRQQEARSRESAPRESRRGDEHRNSDWREGPSLEERVIRRIFDDNREYVSRDADLPPGIRKNLERGKPLPPGIAKRFDDRLHGQLPRYEGYEWRQAGQDAILVDIANEVVYEILRGVVY
ncbi:anti-virulence regulator CigR family protein [Franzmannia qiaohouensis]|uniref:Anti-virulence regulator CigR family protein n=1 Tax=Franzmannia qiaohouensis TaxID=1329370 RepID=A0ABU1HK05_9GAMM|nr:anti-virulence regulator CigR family protein [Halomonas qiaohouensis]MDR5907822.1 anti-virulence regulator CigR family protein [Halomonas qiaohouensis]